MFEILKNGYSVIKTSIIYNILRKNSVILEFMKESKICILQEEISLFYYFAFSLSYLPTIILNESICMYRISKISSENDTKLNK